MDKTTETRRLNDLARIRPDTVNARWNLSQGVLRLLAGDEDTPDAVAPAIARLNQLNAAVARFTDFDPENDPYREHDFGAFELFGVRLIWKIEYYHPDHDTHAPVPSNIELCRRILTVMLAEEY